MMEIGELLREARMNKGLSLDDIQEKTKIQKRYLQAIEDGDYNALPGRFYARAFIKEYAQAVDLDAAHLLSLLDEDTIEVDEQSTYQYTRLSRTKRNQDAKQSSIFSLLPTIIVVVLVVAIIFIAWTLYQKSLPDTEVIVEDTQETDEIIRNVEDKRPVSSEEEAEGANNDEEEAVEEEQEELTVASFETVHIGEGSAPSSELNFHYSGETVAITFEVTDRTYVEIRGSSDTVYLAQELNTETMTETLDVSNEESLYFNIGNASGVTFYFNDTELEYPVNPTEKVHQKLQIQLINE